MAVAPHHYHILHQYREGPVHLFRLRNVGDEILPQSAINRLTENRNIALSDAHKAHQRFKQRRFSRAVHADQRGDRAARDAERGIAQRGVAVAVGDADVVDREARLLMAHACFLSPSLMPWTMVWVVTRSRSR